LADEKTDRFSRSVHSNRTLTRLSCRDPKLLFLVLNLASKDWKMLQREWTAAKAQFAILFEDRFTTI
jgi:transposase-like protein